VRFIGVFNRDGGTLRTMDLDAFSIEAQAILASHGHALECRIVEGGRVRTELERAAKTPGIDVLLAVGGDGTVSSAADVAYRAGVPLAVLPAGTMNLIARSLSLPMTLPGALHAIGEAPVRAVDIASANGVTFVHQYAVGLHPRLVRIRETLEYRGRYGKMLATARAVIGTIVDPPKFLAEIKTPRGIEQRRCSAIQVTNNPIGEGHLPHADSLEQGRLGVYLAAPLSTADTVRLISGVLTGHWKGNPYLSVQELRELTLSFPRRSSSAMALIDGELTPLPPRVELRIHPGALRVVAPTAATGVAAASSAA
jgi:diacylglycerol kinase family enzyme